MFHEKLLDHFSHPRNVGDLEAPALTVEVSNPACGDVLRLAARLQDGRIAEVRYRVRGCTAAIAAGSALTERLASTSIDQLNTLPMSAVDEALGGLPPESQHTLVLCRDAVRALVARIASERH